VSNVWQTRHRLMLERLDELVDQLRKEEPIAPAVLEEQTVRLLAGVRMVLRQHHVNQRGQCKFCTMPQRTWRFWHRRPQCTVSRALDFVLTQRLDIVWWQMEDQSLG
jgi:hypothetical protein